MFLPSTYPRSSRAFRNVSMGGQGSIARIPIVTIFPRCCALAVSGQAAAPPTSPMNSRRFIPSLDHLLGTGKQYPRDHDAESFRRLEIDHKLEFRRCLHRKIRRLGAAENAAHVLRCAPKLVYGMHAIRHEAPRLGKVTIWVNCRNAKLCGERDDKVTMHGHEIIRHQNEAASRFSAKFYDGIFD